MNQFDVLQVILLELDRQFPYSSIDQKSMDMLTIFVDAFIKANIRYSHGTD